MPEVVELSVTSDGGRLDAGAVRPDSSPQGLVLLLHGIPSINPPEPGDTGYQGLAERFASAGFVAGWIDLRAVRGSEGYFSIEGWVRDASAGLDALATLDHGHSLPVAIVGSSAGGAVAAAVASRGARVDALALLAAPAHWVSFAGDPRAGLQRITSEAGMAVAPEVEADPTAWAQEFERVQTVEAIAGVEAPILVVHGTDDDVVPVSHASEITAAARRAEELILVGAGHQLRKDERAVGAVIEWLGSVL